MTTTSKRDDLVELLEAQAREIAQAGHNGWGNTMLEAAAEIAALRAQQAWQPIETAPQDGTLIIVYAETPEHARWPDQSLDLPPLVTLCAWHPDTGFCVCEIREPTHWMPYSPPTQEPTE
jgi:hypothetical protein